jgi:hypothetical protein
MALYDHWHNDGDYDGQYFQASFIMLILLWWSYYDDLIMLILLWWSYYDDLIMLLLLW